MKNPKFLYALLREPIASTGRMTRNEDFHKAGYVDKKLAQGDLHPGSKSSLYP